MRLYLSSFRNGNQTQELHKLLAGNKRTALVMNAVDSLPPEDRASSTHEEIERLKSIDLQPTEVDLRDYFDKPEALKAVLSEFDLLWVRGGNCFVLRRALAQSGGDQLIKDMLEGDEIVYGGYSAGIDMLAPSLHGVEFVDDPQVVPEGYEPEVIWDCLGILPYVVAPHYKSDHPESADIDKSVEYLIDNHIMFKALRDGEVIVVDGDREYIVS